MERSERSQSASRIAAWSTALVVAAGLGCAGARTTVTRDYLDTGSLPRPPVVLIHAFAVDPEDVVVDSLGPNFVRGKGSTSKRSEVGHQVANALAEQIVAKLRERSIPAERADAAEAPLHALVVKGQFVSIDEGDRSKRMVIGFGAGAEKLQTQIQVYQVSETGLRRLRETTGTAHGDRMPGMAVPVGVGAAAGAVARSVVISGGMNIVQEVKGGLDAATENLAEQFAERAETFYQERGWR